MAYPGIWDLDYSYTAFQQSQGDNSFPGTQLDNDLEGLRGSIEDVSDFVKVLARADGALNNGVVTYDALSDLLKRALAVPVAGASTAVGTIQGFNTGNNSADPTDSIDIGPGAARDTAGLYDLARDVSITKKLGLTWAPGSGQGGAFPGTVKTADGTYHVWLIRKIADGSTEVGFDTSPTNPVVPAGYAKGRRIMSFKTDGSAFIKGYVQAGPYVTLKAPTVQSVVTPEAIALTVASDMPLGVKVRASLLVASGSSNFVTAGYVMVRDPDLGVPAVVNATTGVLFQPNLNTLAVNADVWSNAVGQFYTGSAVGSPIMFFVVKGWFDARDSFA